MYNCIQCLSFNCLFSGNCLHDNTHSTNHLIRKLSSISYLRFLFFFFFALFFSLRCSIRYTFLPRLCRWPNRERARVKEKKGYGRENCCSLFSPFSSSLSTHFYYVRVSSSFFFFLFTLHATPVHVERTRLRVFAGRITCLRRRDGGSSLNAATFLSLSFLTISLIFLSLAVSSCSRDTSPTYM